MKRTRSIACNDSHMPASSNNSRSDRAKQPFRDQQFQARDSCIAYRTTSNIPEFLERITRFIDPNFPDRRIRRSYTRFATFRHATRMMQLLLFGGKEVKARLNSRSTVKTNSYTLTYFPTGFWKIEHKVKRLVMIRSRLVNANQTSAISSRNDRLRPLA